MAPRRGGAALVSVLLFWIVPAAGGDVLAQTTFATITGTVTDPAGQPVPGVDIEAVHVQSNYHYTAISNDIGYYTLSQLREGTYLLRARLPGFKEQVVRNIGLDSRDIRRIDIQLELGEIETHVEVLAGATLIETETPRISDSKSADILKSLPINTRSLWNFMALTPTVIDSPLGAYRRFGGSRLNQSDAAIDGITTSNMYDGTQISPLVSYIDSFQEVRVDTSNNSAEFGAVGMVNIVSKSGTNEFHGSIFNYYQTPFFRARDPFALERGTGIRHEPGGTGGGPIRLPGLYDGRDRTFFFFSFETRRGSAIQQLLNPTVPLESWRSGDFSGLSTVIRDPLDNNNPFPNNRIPAERINPVSQRIQERFWPLPNFGDPNLFISQNYREMKTRPLDLSTYWTTRIDHRFSEKAFVFGRYTWNRAHNSPFNGNLPTIGQQWQQRDTRAVNISYTHWISPTLVNEFRWGFAFNNNPRQGPLMGQEVISSLGIQGLADNLPDIPGIFRVTFSQIGLTGIDQQIWRNPGFKNYANQFQEHLSWYRGRHSIRAGMALDRVEFNDHIASNNLFGHANFSARFTGHPYADFLLGIPTSTNRAFPPIRIDRMRWGTNLFITDEFRVHSRVTLTMGLRYEHVPGWIEKNDRQSMFDIRTGKIVVPDGALDKVSPLMPLGYVDVIEASQAGLHSRRLLETDRNNFAPRLGLALRPFGRDTVFRAGYGIFYDVVPRNLAAAAIPFVINEPTFTNPIGNPRVILPQVFPSSVAGPSTVGIPNAYRPDLRIPYSQQWNATIEHERWDTGFRLSYIGKNTRQGEWSYNINQPIADHRPFIEKPRLFPQYPTINYFTNGAGHEYHSMSFEAERRMSRGMAWQFSYTLARDIGDLERGQSPEDAYDRARERGAWVDIPTHRVTGFLIYELPFGRGRPWGADAGSWLNGVLGGWQLSLIYYGQTGHFLTPLWTGPDPTGTRFTSSATPALVTIRPNQLYNPNLPRDQRSVSQWFDAGAFEAPTPGSFGTAARGVIKGPGASVLHAGLVKHFELGERMRLRWEFIATNALNTPNWSNPGTTITRLADVGVIQGVGGVAGLDQTGPRTGRMSLRLEW